MTNEQWEQLSKDFIHKMNGRLEVKSDWKEVYPNFEPNRTDTQYVLSVSYGKDSLACILACLLMNWRIDRIIHAEVWATDTIPAELPPMWNFKAKADEIIKELTGITVERYRAERLYSDTSIKGTYENLFYHIRSRGNRKGQITGFPFAGHNECNTVLKKEAIENAHRQTDRQYLLLELRQMSRNGWKGLMG